MVFPRREKSCLTEIGSGKWRDTGKEGSLVWSSVDRNGGEIRPREKEAKRTRTI